MKKLMTLAILFFAFATYSSAGSPDVNRKFKWEYAYMDLNVVCQRYYSLYPPHVICIKDRLYAIRYKITYSFNGETRVVFLEYIPDENTPFDENGNILPRNHTVRPENKF
jgi:uncharacterized protein YcfJ